jgi:hypothetical protein
MKSSNPNTVPSSLRRSDGNWNLALILDKRKIPPKGRQEMANLETLARQTKVTCQVGWEDPPPTVTYLCIVGHNHPDLQKGLKHWGEKGWLRDRWLFLFVCGQEGVPPVSTKELRLEYGVMGVTASVHNIGIDAAVRAVERLLRKLHSGEQEDL